MKFYGSIVFIFSMIVLISLYAKDACADGEDTVLLNKGQASPFTGYLLNPSRAQRIEWLQLDYTKLQQVDSLKDQEIKTLNEQIQNNNKQINDLNTQLISESSSSHWKEILGFSLGVLSTSLLAYGVFHIVR